MSRWTGLRASLNGPATAVAPSSPRSSPAPARRAGDDGRVPERRDLPDRGARRDRRAGDRRPTPASRCSTGPARACRRVRDYLRSRVASTQGVAPAEDELIVTSRRDGVHRPVVPHAARARRRRRDRGADLPRRDPRPSPRYEAELTGIPMDEEGMLVDELVARFERGYRPKFVYVIPEYQNPSGRTLSLARRHALSTRAAAYGVLIFEDVAYRELSFDGERCRRCGRSGPTSCCRPARSPRSSPPASGWAGRSGPPSLVAPLADAKQNTDQCAGALGQRMVEEYGRAGHFDAGVPRAQALYASHWAALSASLVRPHARRRARGASRPAACSRGSRVPPELDVRELRAAATEAGVAYVPGPRVLRRRRRPPRDAASFSHPRRGRARGGGPAAGGRDRADARGALT